MRTYYGENIGETFGDILYDLYTDPDYVVMPRGMEVKEIRDCAIEIENPMKNLGKNKHRNSPLKYIAAELLWYFSGTDNPAFIENYASLWKNIHNPDGTVNSAYGKLIFNERNEHNLTQYKWVLESLKRDKDSRQAFMHFNRPRHQFLENKDQVCTLQALFHIRDDKDGLIRRQKLHMTVTMRSNDIIYGFMTDWAFFSVLHYHVYLALKNKYPSLEMGSYTHVSHSMHLYERHYKLVEKMINEPFEYDSLPLLTETVLLGDGTPKQRYMDIFEPIRKGEKPDFSKRYDNDLIDWCLSTLEKADKKEH